MTKDEAWEMIDSALDHSYSEKDVMEIKEALAQPAQEPSKFGSPELQAAILKILTAGKRHPDQWSAGYGNYLSKLYPTDDERKAYNEGKEAYKQRLKEKNT